MRRADEAWSQRSNEGATIAARVASTAGSGVQPRNAPTQSINARIAKAIVNFMNRGYAVVPVQGSSALVCPRVRLSKRSLRAPRTTVELQRHLRPDERRRRKVVSRRLLLRQERHDVEIGVGILTRVRPPAARLAYRTDIAQHLVQRTFRRVAKRSDVPHRSTEPYRHAGELPRERVGVLGYQRFRSFN